MTCKRCGSELASTRATYCHVKTACGRARNNDSCRTRYWSDIDHSRAVVRAWAREHPDKAHKWAREHPEANRLAVHRANVKHRARYGERNNARSRAARLAAGAIPRRHASRP